MRIAITRPAEDAAPLAARLLLMGHHCVSAPLLTIVPRRPLAIADLPYQAIAVTSANGIRAFAPVALSVFPGCRSLRVLTVGPQSLQAALQLGFSRAEAHGGDVKGLARYISEALAPADGPLLYLSGQETTGDFKRLVESEGFACVRAVVYDAEPSSSLGTIADELRSGTLGAVMLYSPRSARIWLELVLAGGLDAQAAYVRSLCLSSNVAAILPPHWRTETAVAATEAAMLALLADESGTR